MNTKSRKRSLKTSKPLRRQQRKPIPKHTPKSEEVLWHHLIKPTRRGWVHGIPDLAPDLH